MENTNFIDEIMGFNPQDLSVFNEPTSSNQDSNVYKTNPKLSKADDGKYRSVVRIIYNASDVKRSIVPKTTYAMNDFDGFFMVKSMLGDGNKDCPIFKSWKKLWFSGDESKKEWAKKMYDKSESQWVLVQIMEDENQPELVGQFKVMKLPKAIYEKMSAKMNPTDPKKTPVPIMDYIFGLPLELEVTPGPDDPKQPERKQREISYLTSDFATDYMPIMKIDGTPLFDEAEMELIDTYATTKAEMAKAKTDAKKAEKQKILQDNYEALKNLYKKAFEYVKSHAIDLVDECAYKPWDEATTKRVNNWITIVAAMRDPKTTTVDLMNGTGTISPTIPTSFNEPDPSSDVMLTASPSINVSPTTPISNADDDELPF